MSTNPIMFGACTPCERQLLGLVVDRALREVFRPAGVASNRTRVAMDLEAAHSVCPIDFDRLHDSDVADFRYDIAGIYRHIDRESGGLRDGFMPKSALALSGKFYTARAEDAVAGWDHVGRVYVVEDGGVRLLDPRFDLRNHSPTGFAWGYGGSGPAQLALAILADAADTEEVALQLYQQFKFQRIAGLPRGPWRITADEVARWIDAQPGK